MSSSGYAYVCGDMEGVLDGTRLDDGSVGPWRQIEMELSEAEALSKRFEGPVVFCEMHSGVDLAWIRVFVSGRIVREVMSAADENWLSRGKTLPFEKADVLGVLARRRNAGRSVDTNEVLNAFLGVEEPPPPPRVAKPKPFVAPRPKVRAARVTMPGPNGVRLAPEESFKPPASWAHALDRRRGGWFAEAPIQVDVPGALDEIRNAFNAAWQVVASSPLKAELDPVRAFLDGPPSGALLSQQSEVAAAQSTRFFFDALKDDVPAPSPFIPYWVGTRGLPFAVDCVLSFRAHSISHLRTLRRFLAASSDADYAAARDRAAAWRPTAPHVANKPGSAADTELRIRLAYLFPGEDAWVQDAVSAFEQTPLWGSLASNLLATVRRTSPFDPSMTIGVDGVLFVPAMVEGFGCDFVSHLETEIGYLSARNVNMRMFGEALASILSDEAMQALFRWRHLPAIGKQAAVAVSNYPERAKRLGFA